MIEAVAYGDSFTAGIEAPDYFVDKLRIVIWEIFHGAPEIFRSLAELPLVHEDSRQIHFDVGILGKSLREGLEGFLSGGVHI